MFLPLARVLQVVALLAAGCVVGMLAIFLVTGVGQESLQIVQLPDAYGALLLRNPAALRATLGLDSLFIALYSTVFLCLAVTLERQGAPRSLVAVSGALLALTGFLDMAENFHFLAMLGQAELGVLPSSREISAQVWESMFKFHVSYLGLFLLAFALPRRVFKERLLANLSAFVQLPVGVLIHVTPRALSVPLVFGRFSFFLVGLLLIASIFGGDAAGSDVPARRPDTRPGVSG